MIEIKVDLGEYTGERILWQKPEEHLKEFKQISDYYFEAMQYAKGKRVIDVACGSGWGTFLLSLVAEETFGFDIADYGPIWDTLRFATPIRNKIDPIVFGILNFEKEPVDITADLAVSVETIEHLINPEFFLGNLKAKSLFFTIPCYGNKNPYHKIEYTEQSSAELIKKYFPILEYRMEKGHMIGYAQKYES